MFAGGTLFQKVSSCLEVLDGFMKQPYPIVASMVVADKRAGSGGYDSLTACIARIMGMSNIMKRPKICRKLMSEFFANYAVGIINNKMWVCFHILAGGEALAVYTLPFYLST